jgi:hypothetical protein
MNIVTVIGAIKTYLLALEWTSTGTGKTKFNAVFTSNNWVHDEGYPFAVINDNAQSGESLTNRHVKADTTIRISVCVHYGIIDKAEEDARIEEATLRIREASEELKVKLNSYTFMNSINVDFVKDWSYGDIEMIEDINLLKRDFILNITEVIAR